MLENNTNKRYIIVIILILIILIGGVAGVAYFLDCTKIDNLSFSTNIGIIAVYLSLIPIFAGCFVTSYLSPSTNLNYILKIIYWKIDKTYRNEKLNIYLSDTFRNTYKYELILKLPEKVKFKIEKINNKEETNFNLFKVSFNNSKSYIFKMRLREYTEKNKAGKYILDDISGEEFGDFNL